MVAMSFPWTAYAQSQSQSQSAQEVTSVARASERGALLYAYDQAAWHGTDDMMAKLPGYQDKVGGYIADGPPTEPRLVFVDKSRTKAVYIARFDGSRLVNGKVLGAGDDTTLSALDRRMLDALNTARAALAADKTVFACAAQPFNTVVLPPASASAPVPVYFLTPQTTNNAIPFGGHYEVDVDVAGRAGPVRRFTNSCLNMATPPDLSNGGKPEFLVVTHLLDPTPTEVHVFSSLTLGLPVLVATPGPPLRLWTVRGANIEPPVPLKH